MGEMEVWQSQKYLCTISKLLYSKLIPLQEYHYSHPPLWPPDSQHARSRSSGPVCKETLSPLQVRDKGPWQNSLVAREQPNLELSSDVELERATPTLRYTAELEQCFFLAVFFERPFMDGQRFMVRPAGSVAARVPD